MGSDYHVETVFLEETFDSIGSEFNDVAGLGRISQVVGINSEIVVGVSRIRPQYVKNYLGLFILNFVHNFQRPFDVLDILKGIERGSDSSMKTENLILNKSGKGQPVEKSIDSGKNRSLIFRFFFQLISTLISKSKIDVDLTVLVIASDEMDLLRVYAFEGEEKDDCLY